MNLWMRSLTPSNDKSMQNPRARKAKQESAMSNDEQHPRQREVLGKGMKRDELTSRRRPQQHKIPTT